MLVYIPLTKIANSQNKVARSCDRVRGLYFLQFFCGCYRNQEYKLNSSNSRYKFHRLDSRLFAFIFDLVFKTSYDGEGTEVLRLRQYRTNPSS